ncbi:hypothetical protein PGT21_004003 [Puccinia graminis f. sp. tritici]|uniref:Uncharacterized protein n=1 Tax=Puccinia graminis f. sp. tritici TaxID=56615 RepID=A0A5B0N2W9_PUCGR|nr:hypothetical protein PGTUg99_036278 [Puccinia graminis f. sp. tritici]KAA1093947.1 hypothetical protein PGT21_004003 [Puccinia graminis f. sp. tritici]
MVLSVLLSALMIFRYQKLLTENNHRDAGSGYHDTDPSGAQMPIAPSPSDRAVDPSVVFKKWSLEKGTLPPIPKGGDGDPDPSLSLEKGPGSQVPAKDAPFPRLLAWDGSLPLHQGNVTVVDSRTGSPVYTIMPVPHKHRSFAIANRQGHIILAARDEIKGRCGQISTYNIPSSVSYTVYPWSSDNERWMMEIKGNGRDIKSQKLRYNWHSQGNKGQISFMSNGTQAADFESNQMIDKSDWQVDFLGQVQSVSTLKIEETTLSDHYFLGLWVMVKYRITQCAA